MAAPAASSRSVVVGARQSVEPAITLSTLAVTPASDPSRSMPSRTGAGSECDAAVCSATALVMTISALIRLVGSRTTARFRWPLATTTSMSQGPSPVCKDCTRTTLARLSTTAAAQLCSRSEGPTTTSLPVLHCRSVTDPRGAVNLMDDRTRWSGGVSLLGFVAALAVLDVQRANSSANVVDFGDAMSLAAEISSRKTCGPRSSASRPRLTLFRRREGRRIRGGPQRLWTLDRFHPVVGARLAISLSGVQHGDSTSAHLMVRECASPKVEIGIATRDAGHPCSAGGRDRRLAA
jgi:hypothetical protein